MGSRYASHMSLVNWAGENHFACDKQNDSLLIATVSKQLVDTTVFLEHPETCQEIGPYSRGKRGGRVVFFLCKTEPQLAC